MPDSLVKENLFKVLSEIADAARSAGRRNGEVRLLAVSKTKPIEFVKFAYEAGQRLFGENYVQEAVEKIEKFPQAEWHLIGPLQTNKVKQIVGKVELIQTLDREKLAREIEKAASNLGIVQDVLIQVNIGDEETKSGVVPDEAPALIESILQSKHLRLRGLMSLPPLTENEKEGRAAFAVLRECQRRWGDQLLSPEMKKSFDVLSMGTSSDFRWAILEGATLVRVGQRIFGERTYS